MARVKKSEVLLHGAHQYSLWAITEAKKTLLKQKISFDLGVEDENIVLTYNTGVGNGKFTFYPLKPKASKDEKAHN